MSLEICQNEASSVTPIHPQTRATARHPRTAVPSAMMRRLINQSQPVRRPGMKDFLAKCGKHCERRSRAVCAKPISHCSETLGIEMVVRPQQHRQLHQHLQQQQFVSNTLEACPSDLKAEKVAAWISSHLRSRDEDDETCSTCTPPHGNSNTKSSLASAPLRASNMSRQALGCTCPANNVSSSSSLGSQEGTCGANLSPSLECASSWCHPVDIDPSEPLVCKPMVRSLTPPHLLRDKSSSLEARLANCQNELAELQRKYEIQGSLCQRSLLEGAENLSWRLVDLSAQALEHSCHRNVPGSMDVYEETNSALDRVATLLCSLISRNTNEDDDQQF